MGGNLKLKTITLLYICFGILRDPTTLLRYHMIHSMEKSQFKANRYTFGEITLVFSCLSFFSMVVRF